MKNTCLLSIALLFVATHTLFPAKEFEGQYDMNFKGKDMNFVTSFWVKGGHIKMLHQGVMAQMGEMIMRDGMSTMIVVMPQQRAYLEMPIPSDGNFALPTPKSEEDIPFEKTDETRKIQGYTARKFIFNKGSDKLVIWATDELGSMPFARNNIFKHWAAAMREITGLENFFPLETVAFERNKEKFSMTVTKVEKKELDNSIFMPPPEYRKMTLPASMGGFMGK